ncbi:hypothetical protein [Methylobacterium sp. J-090]|uniref:hypothetical protein n=1 Tax=Methylobacterium sp. J-090 TaxID=2836666 RepID=UPI001FBA11E9|nr:hypothetical protein [Methylobacterium sp. J-090]MCJ2080168.1 hypothetical protein [Methylobacterium sp. J-090]
MSGLSNSLRSRLKKLQSSYADNKSSEGIRLFLQPDDCIDEAAFLADCEQAANGSQYIIAVFIDHADDAAAPSNQ